MQSRIRMELKMAILLVVFSGLCVGNNAFSQLSCQKSTHDFGDITANSNRTVDFFIVNDYKFSIIMNAFLFDLEVSTAYTPVTVKPGDTMQFRVKVFPKKLGDFNKTIPIYFHGLSDTVNLVLKGNALTTKFADQTRLEPFPEKAGRNEEPFAYFPVKFAVIDEQTKKPIPNATISFSAKSPAYKSLKSNNQGLVEHELNNRYEAYIYAYGYAAQRVPFSLGCSDSIRTVYLQKTNPDDKTETEYFHEYEAENPIKTDENYENLEESEELMLLEPLEKGNYKPNNIVFLLDVSISMLDHDRISLLKSAITQLVSLMREKDNISIITFCDDTKIILEPTFLSSINRETIIALINELKAGGMTNGGKGLKMAFKLIQQNLDPTKNNQVILATDGAMGAYMKHEDIVALVKQNSEFVKTSVVTLCGYNWTASFMKEIVYAGKGKLIPINNSQEAKLALIKDVKANSLILEE